MPRLNPEELWRRHILEGYYAFRLSTDWRLLRREGMRILGRRALFTAEEWMAAFHERATSKEYRAWLDKCSIEGQRFGIAPEMVVWTCLLKNYRAEKLLVPFRWPSMRVITESADEQFVVWLTFHARQLGLYVVQRIGSVEVTQVFVNPVPMSAMLAPARPPSLPPLHAAFHIGLDFPVDYPPKAAGQMRNRAGLLAKKLLASLGYQGFQRIRPSSLLSQTEALDVKNKRLPKRMLYKIVAETAPEKDLEGDLDNISVEKDRKRTMVLKSRKHQLRKRLVMPYGDPPDGLDSHGNMSDPGLISDNEVSTSSETA
jgi:hypothetical protein